MDSFCQGRSEKGFLFSWLTSGYRLVSHTGGVSTESASNPSLLVGCTVILQVNGNRVGLRRKFTAGCMAMLQV